MTDYAERVATDSGFRRDLQAARGWTGPRPTVYLDWIQTGTGWSDTDRALARALQDYEAQLCGGCGGYLPETMRHQRDVQYATEVVAECQQCVAQHIRAEAEAADNPHAYALLYQTKVIDKHPAA